MPSEVRPVNTGPPVIAYARFLLDLHKLISEGKGDGEEAEAVADRMDAPWRAMKSHEQARMRGLAADLNTLRGDGPKQADMTKEQLESWQCAAREVFGQGETRDVDAALVFLRRPVPSTIPRHFIPFLQARCWEKLGNLETALLFMKEADRLDPDQALSVMLLLQQLGRTAELRAYADRVIANPATTPLELYLAGVALFSPTRTMSDTEAAPILRQVVAVLERALSTYLNLPPDHEDRSSDADSHIANALGSALARLGEHQSAIDVYSQAIDRHPRDGELYVGRGLALYDSDLRKALSDLSTAARLGVASIWPYLLLARNALQSGAFGEALRLALAAEQQPGPAVARADVYEMIAIALTELGQPQQRVLENFDKALALAPTNERIRENRGIALALSIPSRAKRASPFHLGQAPIETEDLRLARSREIEKTTDLLNQQRNNRISYQLVGV
jgi:tetratricopeptide (TPR) repeat protein